MLVYIRLHFYLLGLSADNVSICRGMRQFVEDYMGFSTLYVKEV
jgi:hypothetical protein